MANVTRAVWMLLLTGVLIGCEDEDCSLGATECMSDSILRVCVEGEDKNVWFVSQCGTSEVCMKGFSGPLSPRLDDGASGGAPLDAGVTDAGPSTAAPSTGGTPRDVCVGACSAGESECVSDALSRYCVAGGVWQLDMCDVGERCVAGTCMVSDDDGAVQRCTPGDRACASDRVEKVCDPDGTAWILQACPGNEICTGTECEPDMASSCDDGNVCMDNKTAIRCLGEDRGFEVVECEGDTYCEGGRCRGNTCAIGSFCNGTINGMAQIRECVDGDQLVDSTCAAGEVCRQRKDEAECEPAACDPFAPDATVCGDPDDPDADVTKTFTTCIAAGDTFTRVPEVASGECIGQTVCDPTFAGTGNPCRQDCTDGAQVCDSTAGGIRDGYRDCDEGEWSPVKRCTEEGAETRLTCTPRADLMASDVPTILCAEPICTAAFESGGTIEGTCDGGRIRRCNSDGTLAEAEDCEEGICRRTGGGATADGYLPGACDTTAECQEGEQRCVQDTGSATPRFQSCDGGVWSPVLETCEDDAACYGYTDSDGMRRKLCDAECAPNTRRCSGGAVQICDATGTWGDDIECSAGRCQNLGSQDAACQLPCAPGMIRCAGSNVTASDMGHVGTSQQQVCGDDGQWEDATDCSGTETCRIGRLGVPTGCVECVGSGVLGGNEHGYADTRCEGTDETQSCGEDNTWEDALACSGSTECVGPTADTCGSCLGPDGTTTLDPCTDTAWQAVEFACTSCVGPDGTTPLNPCTNTAWEAVPVCGSCMGPDGTTTLDPCTTTAWEAVQVCDVCPTASDAGGLPCTTANIAANTGSNGGKTTCIDAGAGAADGAWAGEADCCVNAQQTYGDLGDTCTGSAWAGEADCCTAAQQTYGDLGNSCTNSAWAGEADCCEPAQRTYGDVGGVGGTCPNSPFGGEADCCVAAQVAGGGPRFAYCAEP